MKSGLKPICLISITAFLGMSSKIKVPDSSVAIDIDGSKT